MYYDKKYTLWNAMEGNQMSSSSGTAEERVSENHGEVHSITCESICYFRKGPWGFAYGSFPDITLLPYCCCLKKKKKNTAVSGLPPVFKQMR